MYAVIKTGGKQYRVSPGEKIKVELLEAEPGQAVAFDEVLMLAGEGETLVGAPLVPEAKVEGTVEEHGRGKKVLIYKYKRRKGFHKKQGHRQEFTSVRIDKLVVAGVTRAEAKLEPVAAPKKSKPAPAQPATE